MKPRNLPKILFLLSLFLLFYIFYKSELHWGGSLRNYYKKYYILSFILIFLSIFTFYINNKIYLYLKIFLITIFFSLYSFEFYLSFFSKGGRMEKQIHEYRKMTGYDYDTRSRYEVYNDLKEKNEKVVVKISPKNFINNKNYPLPLSGVSNSETIYCNENGYYFIYQSDRYGFNNPDSEWDRKNIDYLLIGDSFVHGACVNRPNDMASVLRNLSSNAVLNLGYSSNGPLLQLATLKEYLKPNIKNIIWIYFEGNDLNELGEELNSILLKKYLNDINFLQNLKYKQNEVDKIVSSLLLKEKNIESLSTKFIKFIKLFNTREIIFSQTNIKTTKSANYIIEFSRILKQAKLLAKKNESKLFFVYLPDYYRFNTDYDNSSYIKIKKIINGLDIPFIDISDKISKDKDNYKQYYPFGMAGHFNEYGYKKIAEKIFNYTINN